MSTGTDIITSRAVRPGFTVIEVLMVMAIISILVAMLMPIYAVMRREMLRSSTMMVETKVDGCLRLFKTEWGVYPAQASYPDLSAPGATYANNLYYRVGGNLAAADRANVQADVATAAAIYRYNTNGWSEGPQPSPLTYTLAMISNDEPQANFNNSYKECYAGVANRMAKEQTRLAVLAGMLNLHGQVMTDVTETVTVNLSGTKVLPAPASAARPGWANDYLVGALEKRYISGDQVLDAWRRPLIYIGQAVPGVNGTYVYFFGQSVNITNVARYGLGPQGFDISQGPGPGLIARPWLLYGGRVRLSRSDAGDGKPTPADGTYFPTATTLMHSDVRYYAAHGYEEEFEIWSAGSDGAFAYMRDDARNDDNIAVQPYAKELANE